MKSKQLITVKEAAERLSLSVRTIFTLLDAKRLTRYRLSARATRIDAAEVEQLIQTSKTNR